MNINMKLKTFFLNLIVWKSAQKSYKKVTSLLSLHARHLFRTLSFPEGSDVICERPIPYLGRSNLWHSARTWSANSWPNWNKITSHQIINLIFSDYFKQMSLYKCIVLKFKVSAWSWKLGSKVPAWNLYGTRVEPGDVRSG